MIASISFNIVPIGPQQQPCWKLSIRTSTTLGLEHCWSCIKHCKSESFCFVLPFHIQHNQKTVIFVGEPFPRFIWAFPRLFQAFPRHLKAFWCLFHGYSTAHLCWGVVFFLRQHITHCSPKKSWNSPIISDFAILYIDKSWFSIP